MSRKFSLIIGIILIFLVVPVDNLRAYPRVKNNGEAKQVKIIWTRFQLVPKITGGFITGKPADYIEEYYRKNDWDKVFYGVGLAGEYYLNHQNALALNLEITWKDIPVKELSYVRMFSMGAGWLYRFAPEARTSVYFHPELGFISGILPDYPYSPLDGADAKLGRHLYIRVALGLFRFTSTRVNNRAELYYKTAFTKGHKLEQDESREINFNCEGFGLELSVGIPL